MKVSHFATWVLSELLRAPFWLLALLLIAAVWSIASRVVRSIDEEARRRPAVFAVVLWLLSRRRRR